MNSFSRADEAALPQIAQVGSRRQLVPHQLHGGVGHAERRADRPLHLGRDELGGFEGRMAGHDDVDIDRYKISWLWGLMTATARVPSGKS